MRYPGCSAQSVVDDEGRDLEDNADQCANRVVTEYEEAG